MEALKHLAWARGGRRVDSSTPLHASQNLVRPNARHLPLLHCCTLWCGATLQLKLIPRFLLATCPAVTLALGVGRYCLGHMPERWRYSFRPEVIFSTCPNWHIVVLALSPGP